MKDADIKRISHLPHAEVIRENEVIHIKSVFMFQGGCQELFSFLGGCKLVNCTVVFDNEDITVLPEKGNNCTQDLMLTMYMSLVESKKMVGDYLRYLQNIEDMRWE